MMMMKHLTIVRVFFAVVSFLYFALGCTRVNLPDSALDGSIETTLAPTPTPALPPTSTYVVPVTSYPDPLDGTQWELLAFESKESSPSIPDQPLFLVRFQGGSLGLQGGCNSIGGHYVLENGRITITFSKKTEVDCSYLGPDINDVEEAFFAAMQTFDSYTLEGEQLRIRYIDGELLFRHVSD